MSNEIPNVKEYLGNVLQGFNVTQKDFAKLLDLNEKTVSRWIRKNALPRYILFIIELATTITKYRKVSFKDMVKKHTGKK